jgi:agmatinase
MSKNESALQFDPNGPGIHGNLFGLPHSVENSSLMIVPVPWEVTVSQGTGTASAPKALLDCSSQIDLFDKAISELWKLGISMLPIPGNLMSESAPLRSLVRDHIHSIEKGESIATDNIVTAKVNEASETLNTYIKSTTRKLLLEGKMVGLLGGDHSTPLGFIRALAEQHDRFGVLQFDAHADLRRKYLGFTYSHASIMYNALKLPAMARLVQVGVRDYCEEEYQVIQRSMGRVITFFNEDLQAALFSGKNWESLCDDIIRELPDLVYVSFDIDALEPQLCPHTGTPVPGGLGFDQVKFLLRKLSHSGKKIIGFDLCEVSGEHLWDAQVGSRILFELCLAMGLSRNAVTA